MEFPYGMNMETYTKMAGLSAKNILYGIHRIHMELASIPPGIHLECGGTVKTSLSCRNHFMGRSHLGRHKSSSDHSWTATHSKPNKLCFGPPYKCNLCVAKCSFQDIESQSSDTCCRTPRCGRFCLLNCQD